MSGLAQISHSFCISGQNSVVKYLPTLLTLGMIGGLAGQSLRGDQTPPADPDRDLGGPAPLRTLYQWNLIDFAYDSDGERRAALDSKFVFFFIFLISL